MSSSHDSFVSFWYSLGNDILLLAVTFLPLVMTLVSLSQKPY